MGYMNVNDTVGADRTPVKHLEGGPVKKMTKKNKTKYKKAPQAPRRFKSAYMFFSTCKHKEIREELGSRGLAEKTTHIAKLVSIAWKALDPEERERWEEMARQDKARFEVEKSLYTGPWKVPAKKRSQKDPNAPKRPMSAFLAYSHARRAEVKKKNASMNNAEISRVLASLWKGAPEEEKKEHIDKEYKLRQKYLTEIAVWRENTEKELSEQRRHREEIAMKTVAARGGPAAIQEEVAQQHHLNLNYEKDGGAQAQSGSYPGYYPPPPHYYAGGGAGQEYRGSQYPTPYYQASSQAPSQQQGYDQPPGRPSESAQQQEGYPSEYYPPNYGYYPPPGSGYPSGHEHYPNGYGGSGYGAEYPPSQHGQSSYSGYYDQQQQGASYPPQGGQGGPAAEGYDRGQYAHQPSYSYGDSRDTKPAAASADHHREPGRGRDDEIGGQPPTNTSRV